MNRYHRPIKWIALLLTAVLMLSVAPTSFAAKKGQGTVYGLDGTIFCWLYATDTIPEGVTIKDAVADIHMYQGSRMGNEPEYPEEKIFDVQISFVSGDESLKDAVIIEKDEDGQSMSVRIDNDKIRQPGEAVLHFVCEGENLRAEFDRTIRVLDYNEYVPFVPASESVEFTYYPGDVLNKSAVADAAVSDHVWDIAGKLPQADHDKEVFYNMGYRYSGPSLESIPDSLFDFTYDEQTYQEIVTATRPGSVQTNVVCEFNNVSISVPATITVLGYYLDGPALIKPGETAEYTIKQLDGKARSFTYTVEGEGAAFADGKLTAGNEAGTVTLIAMPDTGEPAAKKQILVSDGVLGIFETTRTTYGGFVFNRITDSNAGFQYGRIDGGYAALYSNPQTEAPELYVTYCCYYSGSFMENPEDALAYYDSDRFKERYSFGEIKEQGDLEFDGHPARYYLMTVPMDDGTTSSGGYLVYVRNDIYLVIAVRTYVDSPDQTPAPVTLADLKTAAADLDYDPSDLDIVQTDGVITVQCKEDTHTVTAGKKLNFSGVFPKPEITNNSNINAIVWSVVDAETGEPSADVTITEKGVLTAGKNISSILKVKVVAASEIFHSQTEYDLTVMPVIKKVILEPAEIFLYEGSDAEVTVTAKLDPDVTPIGLTWTTKKEGVVEAKVNDDGTAAFRALAAGKIQYTVKEPGGKTATLKVNVVPPVTALTLSYKGKASPGKTVTITPIFEPKKPGNSAVEWSVNVGEDVATISNKGALKISKDAAPGTVITVTCKALGAPEPVVMTIDVPVE